MFELIEYAVIVYLIVRIATQFFNSSIQQLSHQPLIVIALQIQFLQSLRENDGRMKILTKVQQSQFLQTRVESYVFTMIKFFEIEGELSDWVDAIQIIAIDRIRTSNANIWDTLHFQNVLDTALVIPRNNIFEWLYMLGWWLLKRSHVVLHWTPQCLLFKRLFVIKSFKSDVKINGSHNYIGSTFDIVQHKWNVWLFINYDVNFPQSTSIVLQVQQVSWLSSV